MNVIIRQEVPEDYEAVYTLTQAAFREMEHADGDEQEIIGKLRNKAGFLPELSLVAERAGQIVGHVLFTEITIDGHPALVLGPISVLPELQGRGIGAMLMEAGHAAARRLGFSVCVLVGHADYYPRFGYEPISEHGIVFPFEAPEACKMVKFLTEGGRAVRGTAVFPPELMEGS